MAHALCLSVDVLDKMRGMGCPSIRVPGATSKVLFDPVDVVAWSKQHGDTSARNEITLEKAKAKADAIFSQ